MKRSVAVATIVVLAISGVALPSSEADPPPTIDPESLLDMLEGPDPELNPGVTEGRYLNDSTKAGRGSMAVVHYAGGRKLERSPAAGSGGFARTGFEAGEPTLGITKQGSILFQALDFSSSPIQPTVIRSGDGGRKWKDVSPKVGDRYRHPSTLDPFIYVDPATDRVFTFDFFFGCSLLSTSDDRGKSWTTSLGGCGEQDHQNLFAGPSVFSPTFGYENVVYACSTQAGATIYSVATQCEKSLDGGLTFVPTGAPPYTTERHDENDLGIDGYCHGAIGHGFVGADGTVYIPKGLCGQPFLAISKDEGATWERVQVADNGVPQTTIGVYEHEASVAADKEGNVYYFWIANNRLPYLAVSKDGGASWSKPMMVGRPGLTEAALPTLAIGSSGNVAVAYMGSENSPSEPFPESNDCKPDPVYCFTQLFFLGPDDPKNYADVTWNGYMTVTGNALNRRPIFHSATINPPSDPLVRGTCGPIRCKAVFDFIDVVVDGDGRALASFVDACIETCAKKGPDNRGNEGVLGIFRGGPRLR